MPDHDFDWIDAFTDTPFSGNGCAVVHDAGDLDDATCRRFVAETSLVECTFLEPSEVADHKVRYFLASREIPFAGHPTIATVASLVDRGIVTGDHVTLETGAGIVPVDITRDGSRTEFAMTQVAPVFGDHLPKDIVAAVGGLSPDDIIAPPRIVSTGLPFCITLLRDHDALRRATLDVAALSRMAQHLGYDGTDMMEPFWITRTGATPAGDTFARLLLAPPSPPEDPFTGSATGAMAAYLWHHGLIDRPAFTAEQGHWLGRPGQARVKVLGPRDAITGIRVAGQGHVLMSGRLRLG